MLLLPVNCLLASFMLEISPPLHVFIAPVGRGGVGGGESGPENSKDGHDRSSQVRREYNWVEKNLLPPSCYLVTSIPFCGLITCEWCFTELFVYSDIIWQLIIWLLTAAGHSVSTQPQFGN